MRVIRIRIASPDVSRKPRIAHVDSQGFSLTPPFDAHSLYPVPEPRTRARDRESCPRAGKLPPAGHTHPS